MLLFALSAHCAVCTVYMRMRVCVCGCSCVCVCSEFCSSALSCQLHVSATFRFRLFASSSCCCCCCGCCCCCCCLCLALLVMESLATRAAERMLLLGTVNYQSGRLLLPLPLAKGFHVHFTHTYTYTETLRDIRTDTPGHTQIQNGRHLAQVRAQAATCICSTLSRSHTVCLGRSLCLIESLEYATSRMHFATFPPFPLFPIFPTLFSSLPLLMKNRPHHNIVRSSHWERRARARHVDRFELGESRVMIWFN